uniref:Hypothetical secreted peptide n=1 Tax=Glossina morsitans morsitans TaxID=37546 RepID=D3TSG6_GLOMM
MRVWFFIYGKFSLKAVSFVTFFLSQMQSFSKMLSLYSVFFFIIFKIHFSFFFTKRDEIHFLYITDFT